MTTSNRRDRSAQEMPEVTLRDMLSPIFRHRRVVIISFCCVFAVAILVAWGWAARYYVSTMQVVVEQDRSDPAITTAQVANVNNNRAVTTDQVASEVALLQGDDMMRSIVSTCKLVDDKWSPFDMFSDSQRRLAMRQEDVARGLAKKIKVEAASTSDVIDVKYGRTGEPEVPACVLQTLGTLYLQKHLQLQRPVGTANFFAQETDKYHQALIDAESDLGELSYQSVVIFIGFLREEIGGQVAATQ